MTEKTPQDSTSKGASRGALARKARLEKALRENLHRRKGQARSRDAGSSDGQAKAAQGVDDQDLP